jgi:protein involved in polysaccharide export with SLBB domain
LKARLLMAMALLLSAQTLAAQVPVDAQQALAQRADLQRTYDALTPQQRQTPDGRLLETRLSAGDFQPGDKIQVSVLGDTLLSGTFIIRSDTTVVAPGIDPISLHGVLRSELEAYLTTQLQRYVRNPVVTARSFVRVSVIAEVVRPGFYDLSPGSVASDVIVAAGGLTAAGDPQRTKISRNNVVLFPKDSVRVYFARGLTLDQIGVRSGDEFDVGRRRQSNVIPLITIIVGLAVSAAAIVGIFN